jgi:hypothetical protein
MIRSFLFAFGIAVVAFNVAVAKEPQELFNGKDLEGWDGNSSLWGVKDGTIVGRTTAEAPLKHNEFLIWKGGDVSDFKLTLQYRIKGGNSGIQYRSKVVDPKEWIVGGYQADIDSGPTYSGILYEERGRGILAKRGERSTINDKNKASAEKFADAAELQKSVHAEDWNDYTIEVRGNHMKHTINGKLMSETIDGSEKHAAKKGVLALQIHAGPPMTVEFRKIKYEPLDGKEADEKSSEKK